MLTPVSDLILLILDPALPIRCLCILWSILMTALERVRISSSTSFVISSRAASYSSPGASIVMMFFSLWQLIVVLGNFSESDRIFSP